MATIQNLIQRIKPVNPALYDALNQLATRVDILDKSIDEVRSQIEAVPITGLDIAADVLVFNYVVTRRNIRLSWESPDSSISSYEIRYGTSWTTAERILNTSTTSAVFDPLEIGTHTYLIKGLDSFGNYSVNAASVVINITGPGTVLMTSQAFGSNVLLYWNEPATQFDISYYVIQRNGVNLAQFTGTFANLLELSGGTFNYTIYAVDIAGNEGIHNTITVTVAAPIDFVLQDEIFSTFSGTKINAVVDGGRLIAPINTGETW